MSIAEPLPTDLTRFVTRVVRTYELSPVVRRLVLQTNAHNTLSVDAAEAMDRTSELSRRVAQIVDSIANCESCEPAGNAVDTTAADARNLLLLAASVELSNEFLGRSDARLRLRFWRETLTRVVAAHHLAARVSPTSTVSATAAAWLRSLGILVLSDTLGQPYHDLLDQIDSHRGDWLHLERASLGFDNAMLTRQLLQAWLFSPDFAAAATNGSTDDEKAAPATGDSVLRRALQAAHWLTELLVRQRHALLPDFLLVAEDHFVLAPDQLPDFIADMEASAQRLATVLNVPAAGHRGWRDVWQQIQQKHAASAATATCATTESQLATLLAETHSMQDFAQATMLAESGRDAGRSIAPTQRCDESNLLLPQLTAAVTACRHARCPVSLLVVEMDHFHELARVPDRSGLTTNIGRLQTALRELVTEPQHVVRTGESRFAIILEGADRPHAVASARALLAELRRPPPTPTSPRSNAATYSAGLATLAAPSKNFPAEELLAAALRCLHTAHVAGGNTVKSIDI